MMILPIMIDRTISSKQLRTIYCALAVIASVAATKAMVWPRWPEARPLNQQALTKALNAGGFRVVPIKPLAAKRSAELATSEVIGYSLDNGIELRLMRGAARRRFNFQAAFLATLHPQLQLKQRALSAGPPPYAFGLSQKQPALQTCLVQAAQAPVAFGVTQEELSPLVDQASRSKWSSLKSIAGLQANRNYECILIQTTNKRSTASSIDRSTWLRLLSVLGPALQSERR